ncbi:RNA-binding protein 48-like isoform X2 [Homalodisca vitripennis]|uniref:RNA-binding protein 48-like isoform X2 n=1 Tax=Homalodisca vitripennis TaxID=197043 RepID=UPI001EEA57CC|nr:RNA-binding protein 48-like isoform X2 [Homalodisca vitripennis]
MNQVYTVCDESVHLIISRVPAIKLHSELCTLCNRFGDVTRCVQVPNYETEESFVETYHVQYARIQSARYAKKQLDERAFYGGVLHVCYAPELETVEDTKQKLIQRRKEIVTRIRRRCESHKSKSTAELCQHMDVTIGKDDNCKSVFPHPRNKLISEQTPTLPLMSNQGQNQWHNAVENFSSPLAENKTAVDPVVNHDYSNMTNHHRILERKLKFIPRPVAITKRIVFHKN